MAEGKPFIKNAVWQERLEKIAQETKPSEIDYKKIFEETDNFSGNAAAILEELGVQTGEGMGEYDCTSDKSLEKVSDYLAHAIQIENIIATTHNPPTSALRRKLKTAFLKVVCWPSRRYLYPQIAYNEDMVRASREMLILLAKVNRSERVAAQKAKKDLKEVQKQMIRLQTRIEELEGKLADSEKKTQANPETEEKA